MEIEEVIFDISEALLVPVLVLVIAGLGYAVFEFGALVAELVRRRRRNRALIESAVADTKGWLAAGDPNAATRSAERIAWSRSMSDTLGAIIALVAQRQPDLEPRAAKLLADFDYACIRRLERTRILVRMGPALGLMGTLIPLSPALAGLANGDVETLTDNLRVAFSVTVAGLLIGAIAFAVSLIRDRLYGQDFSDAEYLTNAILGTPVPHQAAVAVTAGGPAEGTAATTAPASTPGASPYATAPQPAPAQPPAPAPVVAPAPPATPPPPPGAAP